MAGYDVIGDIHGHAAKLVALLQKMDFAEIDGRWVPPAGRKAIFLGDLIDRGPDQIKVLNIVKRMVENKDAHCIMGNHELNAIGYMTKRRDDSGEYLRKRSPAKVAQHAEFISQVGEGSPLHLELLDWFKSLPPALDLDGLRVVHAWWHQDHVDLVADQFWDGDRMCDDFLHAAFKKGSREWAAMEGLTKGLEIDLPGDHHYFDHAGEPRKNIRAAWWLDGASNYREVAIVPRNQREAIPDHPLPEDYLGAAPNGAPVFIGHYWFDGEPAVLSEKVACLDWSAAKDGPLVAYRWDGEDRLSSDKLVAAGV